MATFVDFMTPSTVQWTFMKPKPPKNFLMQLKKATEDDNNILYTVAAYCLDDTANQYIQGFIQTSKPVETKTLMKSFGNLNYTPCDSDGDDNPVLTEILLSRLVYEFGETNKMQQERDQPIQTRC
ncbi:hypothetical protein IV203_036413 [Nitzschia inconspicua]|uniref:Uncharacterized protein n=1 Tax=Nitzschia inconspicua TaxID=303405 RepID=A0A9K3LFY4_9STRA|nr:hypothetical protein IV203_036413 [Nitzschia inconspicua]